MPVSVSLSAAEINGATTLAKLHAHWRLKLHAVDIGCLNPAEGWPACLSLSLSLARHGDVGHHMQKFEKGKGPRSSRTSQNPKVQKSSDSSKIRKPQSLPLSFSSRYRRPPLRSRGRTPMRSGSPKAPNELGWLGFRGLEELGFGVQG